MNTPSRSPSKFAFGTTLSTLLALVIAAAAQGAPTSLSDIPLYSASNVPANLMLALSVEFPTGTVAAYTDNNIPLVYTNSTGTVNVVSCPGRNSAGYGDCYFPQMRYLGYFDWAKCYTYNSVGNYFVPAALSTSTTSSVCPSGQWSGNMLNWATMTALDEFRQTLTGGNRMANGASPYLDAPTPTVLVRSRQTAQGSASNFPTKQIGSGNPSGTATMAPSTVIGDAVFASASNVYIRSHNGGTELTVVGDPTSRGVLMEIANNTSFTNNPGSNQFDKLYYARVQVCVPGLLENNCNTNYANPKPEGLIQQNFQRVRVGATGYLVAFGEAHPNGILRALLRDNGPTTYNGFGARQPNANQEWNGVSGQFLLNPDPDEIAASITGSGGSTPTMSGAINYLDQFGYNEPGYETQDTIAELYWATLAYYMKTPLDPRYTAAPGSGNSIQLDAFPAIANPATVSGPGQDPIQYSCQGNAIVSIGDAHTWCDSAVPGSNITSTGSCSNQAPLAAVGTLNAGAYTSALGTLPLIEALGSGSSTPSKSFDQYAGIGDLSTTFEFNDPPGATYNMAGMAYYAHTQDIRPDITDTQTVDTYTVDVMEPGSYDGSAGNPTYNPSALKSNAGPNMYWLAAKYGGFNVDPTQCTVASPLTPCISVGGVQVPTPESVLDWHTNITGVGATNMRPDNYFPGNRPDLIKAGLAQIFNRVASTKILSAAPPGISSSRSLILSNAGPFNTGLLGSSNPNNFPVYVTSYKPGEWSGEVSGQIDSGNIGSNLTPVSTPWSAQKQLDNLARGIPASGSNPAVPPAWSTGRRIVTYDGSKGVPFRFSNLSAAEQLDLPGDTSTTPTPGHPLLDFLRGDQSNEGTKFRVRRHVLGDIVDSTAVLVQSALSPDYTNAANPGYSSFVASVANRQPVVYAGANDGMLHAFAADFSKPTTSNPLTGGGSELFAYVPSFVLAGPNGTPLVDGLAATANLNGVSLNTYNHHFYVDQTPQVADVDFDHTCQTPGSACTAGASPNWHTVLVGGLGKGGRGLYALDITNVPPALDATSSSSVESTVAGQVLWEFSAPDLGYTYSRPSIQKTRKYGWVVLVSSGYDNINTGQDGHGKLYVVDIKTGVLLETLDTGAGTTTTPSGLGTPTGYTQDVRDGTVEQVYAGDLLGNVWRFDLSGTGTYPAPVLLATLTDAGGNPQPVTTAPRIETDVDSTGLGTRRWVFVGTGQFLDVPDLNNTQQQTMYALRDGTAGAPNPACTGSSCSPFALPITRSMLTAQTNLLNPLNLGDSAPGWYYDLTGTAGNNGATERIVVDPDAAAGVNVIAWATLIPTKDPCQFQGAIYAAFFGTGQTALLFGGGSVPSIGLATAVTGLQIVQMPPAPGTFALLYGQSGLTVGSAQLNPNGGNPKVGRTNWREILN